MQEALNRGLLPDDNTLMQLSQEKDSIVHGRSLDSMRWPDVELRTVLIRKASHRMTMTYLRDSQQMLILPRPTAPPPPPAPFLHGAMMDGGWHALS